MPMKRPMLMVTDLDGESAALLVIQGPVHRVEQEQPADLQNTSHKQKNNVQPLDEKLRIYPECHIIHIELIGCRYKGLDRHTL